AKKETGLLREKGLVLSTPKALKRKARGRESAPRDTESHFVSTPEALERHDPAGGQALQRLRRRNRGGEFPQGALRDPGLCAPTPSAYRGDGRRPDRTGTPQTGVQSPFSRTPWALAEDALGRPSTSVAVQNTGTGPSGRRLPGR